MSRAHPPSADTRSPCAAAIVRPPRPQWVLTVARHRATDIARHHRNAASHESGETNPDDARPPRQRDPCRRWLSGKGSVCPGLDDDSVMPENFIAVDREQSFLLRPSLRDWLPEDHLVWTILGTVAELDLATLYSSYRADGHGRAAYDPSMMVALLLYAYAMGNRSSRGIERECVGDVAYRIIPANLKPDHSTIAEFRVRHETALAGLFTDVLALCARAGSVKVGVVAIDGTKMSAKASQERNHGYELTRRAVVRLGVST